MKYLYYAILCMCLAGCVADKDKLIVNVWGLDLTTGTNKAKLNEADKDKLEKSASILEKFTIIIEFKKDGTIGANSKDFSKWSHWKVEDDKLWLIRDNGNVIQKVKIVKLTKDQLALDFNDGKTTYFKARKK